MDYGQKSYRRVPKGNENDLKPGTRNNIEILNHLVKIMLIYLLRKETVAVLRSNGLSQTVNSPVPIVPSGEVLCLNGY